MSSIRSSTAVVAALHAALPKGIVGSSPDGSTKLQGVELAKQLAAFSAVDEWVKDGQVIGVGSGSTVVYAVQRLVQRATHQGLRVKCVPTSFQALQLITENSQYLTLTDLSRDPVLAVAIDGADEVDAQLNCIKGGGACQTQEKIVASCADKLIIIADFRKNSQVLGEQWKKGVPVEVLPSAYVPIMKKMEAIGGKPKLRMGKEKAGPVVTDNGNLVVDVDMGLIKNADELSVKLGMLPGVVETGLFVNMAKQAYFGNDDGSVTVRTLLSTVSNL